MAEKVIVAGIPMDQQPSQEEITVPYNPHEDVDNVYELIDTIMIQAPVRNQSAEKLGIIQSEIKAIWSQYEIDSNKEQLVSSINNVRTVTLENISDDEVDNSSRLVIEDVLIKILQKSANE